MDLFFLLIIYFLQIVMGTTFSPEKLDKMYIQVQNLLQTNCVYWQQLSVVRVSEKVVNSPQSMLINSWQSAVSILTHFVAPVSKMFVADIQLIKTQILTEICEWADELMQNTHIVFVLF